MTTPAAQYNNQIPQTDETIGDSQKPFLGNFTQLYSAFKINHVPLDDATSPGAHTLVGLIEQPSGLTTNAGEIALYSKLVTGQTDELFLRQQGNGTEVQYTAYQVYALNPIKNGTTLYQDQFFSFLPGGIIVYFGTLYKASNPYQIVLNPPICRNIMGINTTPKDINSVRASATPIFNNDKFCVAVTQLVNGATPPVLTDVFYIIFGNSI